MGSTCYIYIRNRASNISHERERTSGSREMHTFFALLKVPYNIGDLSPELLLLPQHK